MLIPLVRYICGAAVITAILVGPVVAQSPTRFEFGGGALLMRNADGWSGRVGPYAQIGLRRRFAGEYEWRLGLVGMARNPDEEARRRIRVLGATAEIAIETPVSGVYISGGLGFFAVDVYERFFDDAVGVSQGSFGPSFTIGTRHPMGRRTLDLRLRVIKADLGDGVTTLTFGAAVSP